MEINSLITRYNIMPHSTSHNTIRPASSGFTIVELMVVVSLFALIFAFTQINLTGLIAETNLQEQTQAVVSDLRRQQQGAMNGSAQPNSVLQPYGVYFDDTSYWVFSGAAFDPATAFEVKLEETLRFSDVRFAQNSLLFEPLSGEVQNYDPNLDEFEIENTASGERIRVEINALGVPAQR